MTTTPFPGTDDFTRVWLFAMLTTDERHRDFVVGTQHLLRGLIQDRGIGEQLQAYDVTPAVLALMVRGEVPETGVQPRLLSPSSHELVNFSDAAAAALERCQAQPSLGGGDERLPVDLLLALLTDSQNRATSILLECGVNLDELRESLREGRVPARTEALAPELHRTRDALLGRVRYRPQTRGVLGRLQRLALRLSTENFAAAPVLWTRLEADELAREQGRPRMASDDVLLALLNTHQVALAYPHLVGPAKGKYGGGQALLAAGIDQARVRAVRASTDLGKDAVSPPRASADWGQDTRQILDDLVFVEGNRSTRLLKALGVSKGDLA